MLGIVGREMSKSGGLGVPKTYLDFFNTMGHNVIPIFPTGNPEELLKSISGLILPGGPDVLATRYGSFPSLYDSHPDAYLEWADAVLLPRAFEMRLPILGICRGLQTLNVFFGGTLEQDLREHPTSVKSRGETVHKIVFLENPRKIEVNSLHHQAVTLGRLASCLSPRAMAEKEDIVEALAHPTHPIRAVQWHPEEWNAGSPWAISFFNEVLEK